MRTAGPRRARIFTGPLRLVNREHPPKNTFPVGLVPVDSRRAGILLECRPAYERENFPPWTISACRLW